MLVVTLFEEIDIPAPFEKLNAWVDNFAEEFVKWRPYHLACELLDGGLRVGDRVRFREVVMGIDYDVTGTITFCERSADAFKFIFVTEQKMAVLTFAGKRTEEGCRFSHTEAFGLQTPLIGPLVNGLIFKVLYRKKANWRLIRGDMILDNQYLKEILTEGKYPERLPEGSLSAEGAKGK